MSLPARVFLRVRAPGWLVLVGSLPGLEGAPIWMERLLAHTDLSRPVNWLQSDLYGLEPAEFLNALEDILDRSIEPTPVEDLGWENSGLLFVSVPPDTPEVQDRILECLRGGGTLTAIGGAAAALGEMQASAAGQVTAGLGWMPSSVILTPSGPGVRDPAVLDWLRGPERRYALRFSEGSVLALGPEGEVEVWSEPPPAVTLGPSWTRG